MKGNLAKATNELGNVIRVHAKGGGISDSEVLTNMIKEREEASASIKAKISLRERERERRDGGKVDRTAMQGILTDCLSLYETFDKDHKRQLNQILCSVTIPYLKAGSTEGEIELRIRGNWGDHEGVGGHKKREPESSHIWFPWLLETHENSNCTLLNTPIEISNSTRGEKAIAVAESPHSSILPLSLDYRVAG